MSETVLKVENLVTAFRDKEIDRVIIDHVSFDLKAGETLGIVGESGSGKSVTSLSVMRLLPKPAGRIENGRIEFKGQNLLDLPFEEMYKIRGNNISMIFQEPMTALNPVKKVGAQLSECYELHFPEMSPDEIRKESIELLEKVGIPLPERRLDEFPHQLSGGLRQRVVIAMALACKPDIIIADEPTTALDVTIQSQILALLKDLQREMNTAIIFITHDLGVIAEVCDRVAVMYAGQVVEIADVEDLYENPKHPYTKGLLNSIPRLDLPPKTELNTIEGMVPDFDHLPAGCRFENRCPQSVEGCKKKQEILDLGNGRQSRCFRANEF